ncbi:uncharacterized protein LOC108475179 [Gossypium arboreum]|uniref:uncharacterized protein LOC108475179 n=1 Tax=Gossypium arboreum TaxID=29729 RepID=UPI0008196DA6|nr:uncharacterized protein LOC108475179 [Gossypium arboreum]
METEALHSSDTPRHSSSTALQGQNSTPLSNIQYFSKHDTSVPNPSFLLYKKQDKFLTSWLLSTVTDEILHASCLYSVNKANLTVKEYLAKVKTLCDSLIATGSPISKQEQVSIILAGLSMEYESIRVLSTEMLIDCETRQLALLTEILLQANLASYHQQATDENSTHTGTSHNYQQ